MESSFLIAAVILFVFSTLVLTILLVLQRNSNLKPEEFSETIENIYKKREEEFKVSSKESIEKIGKSPHSDPAPERRYDPSLNVLDANGENRAE